jgi:hypothetical protein
LVNTGKVTEGPGIGASPWKAMLLERRQGGEIVEDPGITRLDIDRYRRSLKLNLSDSERKEILRLLADAELRMQNGFTSVPRKAEK